MYFSSNFLKKLLNFLGSIKSDVVIGIMKKDQDSDISKEGGLWYSITLKSLHEEPHVLVSDQDRQEAIKYKGAMKNEYFQKKYL